MEKRGLYKKFSKMIFLLFCIHYTNTLQSMHIGVAIATSAIKYSMLYSLPENAGSSETGNSIFSVIVDMKLLVAVKRGA